MGTIVLSGTAVLVILGFGNNLYWLAAVAVLFLYLRYGRDASASSGGAGGGSSSGGSMPSDYRAYRDRRDMQAKWERRYRRERPLESRRQQREKSS
ncbi:hypothetical protein [Streptomyces lanatus]|uniref:Integral membrane protein n=1 Tax=Streptomyces lanatus TaxID=66900 RepID=A0ABV1Y6H4_9ACTN|nr:hypothetical protein [Streptomyces lanatus]GHH31000.1 hypothetical protein GCM10018780_91250 [Streptomyces lanatus]